MSFYFSPNDLSGAVNLAIAEDVRANGSDIGGCPQVSTDYIDKNTLRVTLSWTEEETVESTFDLSYSDAVRFTKAFIAQKEVPDSLIKLVQVGVLKLELQV